MNLRIRLFTGIITFFLFSLTFGIFFQPAVKADGITMDYYPANWSELSVFKSVFVFTEDVDLLLSYKVIDSSGACNNSVTGFSTPYNQGIYISNVDDPNLIENKRACIKITDPDTNQSIYEVSQTIPVGSVLSYEMDYYPNDWNEISAYKGVNIYTSASSVYYNYLDPNQACNGSSNLPFQSDWYGVHQIENSDPNFIEGKKICIRMVFSNKTVHAETITIPSSILEYKFDYYPENLNTPSYTKNIDVYSRYTFDSAIIGVSQTCDSNTNFVEFAQNRFFAGSNDEYRNILANQKICIKLYHPSGIQYISSESYTPESLLAPSLKYYTSKGMWGAETEWSEPTLYKYVILESGTYDNNLAIIASSATCNASVSFDDYNYYQVYYINTLYIPEFTENTKLCYKLVDSLGNIQYLESLPILPGTLPQYIIDYDEDWSTPTTFKGVSVSTLGELKVAIIDGAAICNSSYTFESKTGYINTYFINNYIHPELKANKKACLEITFDNDSTIYVETDTIAPESLLMFVTYYYPEDWSTPSVNKWFSLNSHVTDIKYGIFDSATTCDGSLNYPYSAYTYLEVDTRYDDELTIGKKVCVEFTIAEDNKQYYSSQTITEESIDDYKLHQFPENLSDPSHSKSMHIETSVGNKLVYNIVPAATVCNSMTVLPKTTSNRYLDINTYNQSIKLGEKVCFRIKYANNTFSKTYQTDSIINLYGYDLDPIESISFNNLDKFSKNLNITLKPNVNETYALYYKFIDGNQACTVDTLSELETICFEEDMCFDIHIPLDDAEFLGYFPITSVNIVLDNHNLNGKKMCYTFEPGAAVYTSPIISGLVEKKDFTSSPDRGGIFNNTEQSTEE
jgi:hypothetical protein